MIDTFADSQGDSGGPLMCLREESMTTVLCGVVTGGDSLCRTRDDHPAFYTRVSEYREWIRQRIDGMKRKSNQLHL